MRIGQRNRFTGNRQSGLRIAHEKAGDEAASTGDLSNAIARLPDLKHHYICLARDKEAIPTIAVAKEREMKAATNNIETPIVSMTMPSKSCRFLRRRSAIF